MGALRVDLAQGWSHRRGQPIPIDVEANGFANDAPGRGRQTGSIKAW